MGVPGNANALLLRSAAAAGGYQVSRSLRFNSSDSAFCSFLPSTSGNRKKWTLSIWVKRSRLGASQAILHLYNYPTPAYYDTNFAFNSSDQLVFNNYDTSAWNGQLTTAAVFRDCSAWYHIVCSCDTDAATPIKIYVNNVQQTLTGTQPSAGSNTGFSYTATHRLGINYDVGNGLTNGFNGYFADPIFIDSQALTPSSFTEVSATTGQLIPKAYTGSYGTNGFRLTFSDNSGTTSTTLGKDSAGSNNWTPNNFSVAAGAGNDSLVDTPTNYGTDTGAGGEVRGNYCTLNPLIRTTATYTNGNLDVSLNGSTSGANPAVGTIFASSGRWYWEVACVSADFGVAAYRVGITTPAAQDAGLGNSASSWCFLGDGKVFNSGTATTYGTSTANGDILNIALDVDAGRIWYGRNGTWFASGNPATNTSPSQTFTAGLTLAPAVASGANTTAYVLNFGQRPFAYAAPSGFKALCTQNLPAPVVAKPSEVMDVKLYTGNGSTQNITGLGFSPDFIWIKARSQPYSNTVFDVIRGATNYLYTDTTGAEGTGAQFLTAFNSDGFSLGTNAAVNQSSTTYAAWTWDAGSSTVTNTQGSINSQVRANASAGFSIVSWTPQASGGTVGHGLNVAPEFIITKDRATANGWFTYHKSLGIQNYLVLNLTNAVTSNATVFSTAPTSTVFNQGSGFTSTNGYGNQICYCFAPVAGYSSFGSYVGNGSSDGVFQWCGFRPRWILLKSTGANGASWTMLDTARSTYNQTDAYLFANASSAEGNAFPIDILSNGFKLRTSDGLLNSSSYTYVWAAFAENPFQYARAR